MAESVASSASTAGSTASCDAAQISHFLVVIPAEAGIQGPHRAVAPGSPPARGRRYRFGLTDGDDNTARRLCRDVRADDRRPAAPGRYRALRRDRERSDDLWRRGQIRRRQSHPRRHGAGAGESRRGCGRYRHHQCRDPRPLGIVKADIGIRDGRISSIGKAGNPDIQPGVDIVVGPGTEVIAGEGRIVTAGGIDSHIHFICPQLVDEALYSGITTMLGGGTGPAAGTAATTCTPGPWHLARILQAAEAFPMNLGFYGKGNASLPRALAEQIEAGACGVKLHEDWGTTPAAIDNCLAVADRYDVQVAIHTDTLNESGFVEDTIAAFKGRTIHALHTEGAGGGHAPDIIKVC